MGLRWQCAGLTGSVLVLHWCSTGTTFVLHFYCAWTMLVAHKSHNGAAMVSHVVCTGAALKLDWHCMRTTLVLLSSCSETSMLSGLEVHWCCTGLVPKLYSHHAAVLLRCYCASAALALRCGTLLVLRWCYTGAALVLCTLALVLRWYYTGAALCCAMPEQHQYNAKICRPRSRLRAASPPSTSNRARKS